VSKQRGKTPAYRERQLGMVFLCGFRNFIKGSGTYYFGLNMQKAPKWSE